MREIKFRAWDKEKKEMVTEGVVLYQRLLDKPNCVYDEASVAIGFGSFEKEYFEFMQYTGLKDKNGKEIYEGDIVKLEDRILEVKWFLNHASFHIVNDELIKKGESHGLFCFDYLNRDTRVEVIGNIYETHELLEV